MSKTNALHEQTLDEPLAEEQPREPRAPVRTPRHRRGRAADVPVWLRVRRRRRANRNRKP